MLDNCPICGLEKVLIDIPGTIYHFYGGDIVEEETVDCVLICPNSCNEETDEEEGIFDSDDIPF
ncbi:hypothetical protein [Desulfolucanica intricata]|uniref:hypothetical protein n=1 Tax=Desulfolucanica intricata TaxID=1285191 RepID=UPI0008358BBE|nr:hypothetical protein [Desulfolucanica intricata]